ncbi:unnamed protein product [Leuciscus chuanchicus]
MELEKNFKDMEEIEKNIDEQNHKLQDHIRDSEQKKNRFGFFRIFVPFFGAIHDALTEPEIAAKTKSIKAELSNLNSQKRNLQNEEWNIKVQRTDLQLKLATSKIKLGVIPSPDHLKEVQECLDQIRQILVDLKKFWEKVAVMLDTLKDKTFIGEDLIDDLDDLKEKFLSSIEEGGKYWKRFGACCYRAQSIFSVQSKDAYKFLEINPSSLSENERKAQYKSIMEKLKKINPQGSSQAAITE